MSSAGNAQSITPPPPNNFPWGGLCKDGGYFVKAYQWRMEMDCYLAEGVASCDYEELTAGQFVDTQTY